MHKGLSLPQREVNLLRVAKVILYHLSLRLQRERSLAVIPTTGDEICPKLKNCIFRYKGFIDHQGEVMKRDVHLDLLW